MGMSSYIYSILKLYSYSKLPMGRLEFQKILPGLLIHHYEHCGLSDLVASYPHVAIVTVYACSTSLAYGYVIK